MSRSIPTITNALLFHYREVEANPDNKIGILYKHGCYAEGMTMSSIIPYLQNLDKDGSKSDV